MALTRWQAGGAAAALRQPARPADTRRPAIKFHMSGLHVQQLRFVPSAANAMHGSIAQMQRVWFRPDPNALRKMHVPAVAPHLGGRQLNCDEGCCQCCLEKVLCSALPCCALVVEPKARAVVEKHRCMGILSGGLGACAYVTAMASANTAECHNAH